MTDAIITDAGFESISYKLATQFFSASDIQYWWTSVAGLDQCEAIELEKQIIQSKADDWQIVQEFLSTFDWLPEKIDVVTARAVFTPAYQWVKVIELGDKQTGEWMSDTYEREAIAQRKSRIQKSKIKNGQGLAIPNLKSKIVWSIIFPKA
jgi:hypothetical protein